MQLNILRDFTEEMADQIRIYHYVEELVFSYRQFMTSHLKEEDIPLQECPLFIRLRFYDNKTQRELANEFHFTEGYTAKVLRNFEERNLISRVENPENRRQKIVSLTDDGKEYADYLISLMDMWEHEVVSSQSNVEIKNLKTSLYKMVMQAQK